MQGQNLDKYLQERQHAPRQRHKQKPKRKLDEMLINYHFISLHCSGVKGFSMETWGGGDNFDCF